MNHWHKVQELSEMTEGLTAPSTQWANHGSQRFQKRKDNEATVAFVLTEDDAFQKRFTKSDLFQALGS